MALHGDTQSSWRRWHNDDADYILSCVTKEDLKSLKGLFKRKLGNPGNIFDRFGRYFYFYYFKIAFFSEKSPCTPCKRCGVLRSWRDMGLSNL